MEDILAIVTTIHGRVTAVRARTLAAVRLNEVTFLRRPSREEYLSIVPCIEAAGRWRLGEDGPWMSLDRVHTLWSRS